MQWHKISEKLPESRREVLVKYKEYSLFDDEKIIRAIYFGYYWCTLPEMDDLYSDGITHWSYVEEKEE